MTPEKIKNGGLTLAVVGIVCWVGANALPPYLGLLGSAVVASGLAVATVGYLLGKLRKS